MIDTSRLLLKFIPTKTCADQTTYSHQVDTSGELQHLMAKKEFIHRVVDAETGEVVKGIHLYRDGDAAVFVDTKSCKRLFVLEEFFFGPEQSVEFDVNYMMYDGPVCNITPVTEQTLYNAPPPQSPVSTGAMSVENIPLSASVSGTSGKFGGFFGGGWVSKLAMAGLGLAAAGYAYSEYEKSQEEDIAELTVNPSNGSELSGRGEPGSTINIDLNGDGTVEYTTTVNNDGSWSFKPEVTITNVTNIKITSTVDDTSKETTVVLDTEAPNAPVAQLDSTTDSGTKGDNVTSDTTPIISGTGTPGDMITVTIPGTGEVLETVVNAQGQWGVQVTTAIPDGTSANVSATATDPAGNTGPAATSPLTIDTTAPTGMTGELDADSDTGIVGDATTADQTPTISGTGTAGDTISVTMPGTGEMLTTMVDANGAWSVTPTQNIANGTTGNVVIMATDPAGNQSTPMNVPITIDANATGADADLAAASDTGTPGDGITSDATPEVVGTGDPGDTITVTFPGTNEEQTVTVDANGDWSVTAAQAIPDGTAGNIVIVAEDASGNKSPETTVAITIDTTDPAVPTAELDPASDSDVAGDNITSDQTPTIRGTGEAGETVSVEFPSTGEIVTATIANDGSWSVTPTQPLPVGTDGNAVVQVSDAAGNTSTTVNVALEIVAPTGPAAEIDAASDTGASTTDGITSDTTPTVTGTGTPGDTVDVTFPGTNETLQATVDANGDWTVTATNAIPHGTTGDITVVVTDADNNVSPETKLPLTIDTTAPTAPTAQLDAASDTGPQGDGYTSDTTPTITGTGEPGSTVSVTMPGTDEILTAVIDNNGDWTVTATQPIALGTDDVASVRVTDPAGNLSPITTVDLHIAPDNNPHFTEATSDDVTTYDEGGAAVSLVDPATFGILDADSTNLSEATVTIKTNFVIGDMLTWTDTGNVTGDYNAETGVLTFTGADTVANYEAALESVKFSTVGVTGNADTTRSIGIEVKDDTAGTPLVSEEHTVNVIDITPMQGTEAPNTLFNNFTEDWKGEGVDNNGNLVPGVALDGQAAVLADGTHVTVADALLNNGNGTTRTEDISIKFYNPDGSQTDWINVELDGEAVGTTSVQFYNNPSVMDYSYTDGGGTDHTVVAVGTTTVTLDPGTGNPTGFQSHLNLIEYDAANGTATVVETIDLGTEAGVSIDKLENGDLVVASGAQDTTIKVFELDNTNAQLTEVDSVTHNIGYQTDKISVTAVEGGFIYTHGSSADGLAGENTAESHYYTFDAGTNTISDPAVDSITINTSDMSDGNAGAPEAMNWDDGNGNQYIISSNDEQVYIMKLDPDAATATDTLTLENTINFDTNYTDTANPNGLGIAANADQIQFTDLGNGKALVVFGETDAVYNGQMSAGIWDMTTMEFDKPVQNNVLDNYFSPVSVAYDPDTELVTLGGERLAAPNGAGLNDPIFYRFTLNDADDGGSLLVKCVGFVETANEGDPVSPFSGLWLNDYDSTNLALIKVSVAGAGFDAGNDTLGVDPSYTLPAGVDVMFNPTSGNLLITGVKTVAEYQEILHNIEFTTTSNTEGNRNIEITAYDEQGNQDESPLMMVVQVQDPNEVTGTAGDDTLGDGSINIDKIIGGQGSDTMTGGAGQDIFVWNAGDDAGTPTDTITDFVQCFQDDKLDLSGLLVGETNNAATLDNFLNFTFDAGTGNTTIEVSPDGDGTITQNIVLEDVDLTKGKDEQGNATNLTDEQIIQNLLDNNILVVG